MIINFINLKIKWNQQNPSTYAYPSSLEYIDAIMEQRNSSFVHIELVANTKHIKMCTTPKPNKTENEKHSQLFATKKNRISHQYEGDLNP